MDDLHFDALVRALRRTPTRRLALGLLTSSFVGSLRGLDPVPAHAAKGKGKGGGKGGGKKRRCCPKCRGKNCGPDGCGGTCGPTCTDLANAHSVHCNAGVCTFFCNLGRGDCDFDPTNGCETDLTTSAKHCGQCGHACAAQQVCQASKCCFPNGAVGVCTASNVQEVCCPGPSGPPSCVFNPPGSPTGNCFSS
jgi:hypothetical protein